MSEERRRRADALFSAALDLPPAARGPFIERECGEDEALRALVERLLSHVENEEDPLIAERGALGGALGRELARESAGPEAGERELLAPGTRVGAFRVVEKIGEGGMAEVYRAERDEGTFAQEVALKVLKRGVDTAEIVARFEREREILGRSRHPDIARIFDGGSTEEGRPYIAMELVRGLPLDEFCDAERLAPDERLRLVARVARAVAAAHQELVVHRDIKPSNVIVTAEGELKLLDFGIAKLIGEGDQAAARTATGLLFMTPAYASPEQVLGGPITTATDVYQLGLLAWTLLVGRPPFAEEGLGPVEIGRRIVDTPLPRPLTALRKEEGERARARLLGVGELELRRLLRGDVEAILMKALARDPRERYDSVGQLVDDIERYLARRPVSARPYTFFYRSRLFVRRHRWPIAAASAVALLVVALAVTSTVQAGRIAAERDRAEAEREAADRAATFFARVFADADPDELRGGQLSAFELLEQGRARLDTELEEHPRVRARIGRTLGSLYLKFGDFPEAEKLYRDALESYEATLGRNHEETVIARLSLATALDNLERLEEAEALMREALADARRVLGPDHENTLGILNNLGIILMSTGRGDEAEVLLEEAHERRRRVRGEDHDETLATAMNLALIWQQRGDIERALEMLEEIAAKRRAKLGDTHRVTLDTLFNVAAMKGRLGRIDESVALFEEIARGYEATLGPASERCLFALSWRSRVLTEAGRLEEAIAVAEEAWRRASEHLEPSHPRHYETREQLAVALRVAGELEAASRHFEEALPLVLESFGPTHPIALRCTYNEATMKALLGRHDEALEGLTRALDHGFAVASALEDSDWSALRDDPRYRAQLERLRAASAAR